MSPLVRAALVFVGGGLGANLRYWLGLWISGRTDVGFPWSTFIINVSGSFAIGLILGILTNVPSAKGWQLFLVVGGLGGYTTFSSFSNETLSLLREKSYLYAAGNVLGSCILGIAACGLGLLLSQALPRN